jgi:hypothetical protein
MVNLFLTLQILNRTIRVDHVEEYKMPKKKKDGEPGTDNTHILDNLPSKLHFCALDSGDFIL